MVAKLDFLSNDCFKIMGLILESGNWTLSHPHKRHTTKMRIGNVTNGHLEMVFIKNS
jgi:hypothetical protein